MTDPRIDLQQWLQENNASCQSAVDSLHPAELTTDSRALQPQAVFLPLVGENFDGHTFLLQAFAQGARLAFCNRAHFATHRAELTDLPLILVDDTLEAYQSLARAWHRRLGTPVVAITGSSGKTSTKEILFQVLSPFFRVHRTQANYNNEIGVPKTLLDLQPEHEICIIEMGMRGLGQIAALCAIAEPKLGIITNVGPVHLSELGSLENIAQAKWELADWLQAHAGTLVINADNAWLQQLSAVYGGRLLRCGSRPEDDFVLLSATAAAEGLQQIRYRQAGSGPHSVSLDLAGEHQALNLLCCLGVLHALDRAWPEAQPVQVPRLFGRQQRTVCKQGPVLINDAYNANPDSMRAALKVLAAEAGRRIAVLGKMAELGPEADSYHRQLGAFCSQLQLDAVYVLGAEARPICEQTADVPCRYFAAKDALIQTLKSELQAGDTVLFKASRSASLEEVAEPVTQYFATLAD